MQIDQHKGDVDETSQAWLKFTGGPVYVISGDLIHISHPEYGKISWEIHASMVLIGCRLDGWPIEVQNGVMNSVQFDSISRHEGNKCLD